MRVTIDRLFSQILNFSGALHLLQRPVNAEQMIPSAFHLWWLNSYPESFEGGDVQQTKTVKDFTPAF